MKVKIKDLMFGDVVYTEDYVHISIVDIEQDFANCEYEPVPLTRQMLLNDDSFDVFSDEKSFQKVYCTKLVRVDELHDCFLVRAEGDHGLYIECRIKYVHELQHIMRLCGFNNTINL